MNGRAVHLVHRPVGRPTLEEVAELAAGWGYDGLEIAVSEEHLDAWRWDDEDYIASVARSSTSTARACGRSPTT